MKRLVLFTVALLAANLLAATVEVSTVTELINAVSAAEDGTEIHLAPGIYDLPATELCVNAGVRIYGDDWRTTVIRQVNKGSNAQVYYASSTNYRVMTLDHADAKLENVTITGGRGGSYCNFNVGGGIKIGFNGGTISDCMISNNLLYAGNGHGAGVGMQGGTIRHSYIIKNTAVQGNGGGMGFYSNTACANTPLVDTCLIADNTTAANGGGLASSFSGAAPMGIITVRNCTIAHNSADIGGGIHTVQYPRFKIENCIIAGNSATTTSGSYSPNIGLPSWESVLTGNMYNCLIGNDGDQKAVEGNGNKKGAPAFKAVEEGDYHLLKTSEARSLGVWFEGILTDLDGLARTSPNFDAGCYQYVEEKVFAVFAAIDRETAFVDEEIRFTATPDNPPEGATLTYQWTLKSDREGVADITFTGQDVSRSVGVGSWTASVTCTSDTPASSVMGKVDKTIKIGVRKLYVTSKPNDQAEFPYDTADKAATNLVDVLDGLIGGETIDLDEGVHITKSEPLIDKATTLVGRGVDRTILKAGGLHEKKPTRVLCLNHASSMVSNLTLQGQATIGHFRHGSVLNIGVGGGTVARCRITGGSFADVNGYGGGVAMLSDSARLLDCEIDSCTNAYGTGAALYCEKAGLIRGCLIRDCYSAGSDVIHVGGSITLESCTIANNRTDGNSEYAFILYGGGVFTRCENNIFAHNSAPNNTQEESSVRGKPNWSFMIAGYIKNIATNCWCGSTPLGTDGIVAEPMFYDEAAGDYRLEAGSPCAKSGHVNSWMVGALDLAGQPRLRKGTTVALGCYQRASGGLMLILR